MKNIFFCVVIVFKLTDWKNYKQILVQEDVSFVISLFANLYDEIVASFFNCDFELCFLFDLEVVLNWIQLAIKFKPILLQGIL
jgi:hypothetical protein